LTVCVVFNRQVYLKWGQNAVIINLANKETSIFNIPFPAVTICPESKIVPSNIWRSQIMAFICNQVAVDRTLEDPNFQEKICDVMHTAKPNFQVYDYNTKFSIMRKIDNKTCMFTPIITEEGFYFYNILHRDEIFNEGVLHYRNYHNHGHDSNWSIEGGYTKQASTTYSYRTYVNDSSTSFHLFA
ncbi:ASC domain containing protein, partial [Asbolus verrucosus]